MSGMTADYQAQNVSKIDQLRCEWQLEIQCRMGQPELQLDSFEMWLFNRALQIERERCAKVAEDERVDAADTGEESDAAYNLACEHVAQKIRSGESTV